MDSFFESFGLARCCAIERHAADGRGELDVSRTSSDPALRSCGVSPPGSPNGTRRLGNAFAKDIGQTHSSRLWAFEASEPVTAPSSSTLGPSEDGADSGRAEDADGRIETEAEALAVASVEAKQAPSRRHNGNFSDDDLSGNSKGIGEGMVGKQEISMGGSMTRSLSNMGRKSIADVKAGMKTAAGVTCDVLIGKRPDSLARYPSRRMDYLEAKLRTDEYRRNHAKCWASHYILGEY
mmetsp:Transcript_32893/g.84614  ORF Transcript_32893/g.84614 Transcript_32893/m.84614 type:complete len:237 (-) Transcript_32893:42-752(-)